MSNEDNGRKSRVLSKLIIFVIPAIIFLVIAVQLFAFIEPWLWPLHLVQGNAKQVTQNVIIGPYPHAQDLSRLKSRSRVVEIVSLMSPTVPGESQLLADERRAVRAAGLKFTSSPLSFLPLHSDANERQAKRVANYVLAKYGPGAKKKVYIHCYLGQHRVGLVEETIKQVLEGRDQDSEAPSP